RARVRITFRRRRPESRKEPEDGGISDVRISDGEQRYPERGLQHHALLRSSCFTLSTPLTYWITCGKSSGKPKRRTLNRSSSLLRKDTAFAYPTSAAKAPTNPIRRSSATSRSPKSSPQP